ncbi:hypothetical protein [Amycolatopsis samaneae]|uniref:Uncharacterized protein n=1 Tax=Amycolatopsis samaneae TaxID=664691 RepID=A0ABW5GTN7_9PSEU
MSRHTGELPASLGQDASTPVTNLEAKIALLNRVVNAVTNDLYDRIDAGELDDNMRREFRGLGLYVLEIGVCLALQGQLGLAELEQVLTTLAGEPGDE